MILRVVCKIENLLALQIYRLNMTVNFLFENVNLYIIYHSLLVNILGLHKSWCRNFCPHRWNFERYRFDWHGFDDLGRGCVFPNLNHQLVSGISREEWWENVFLVQSGDANSIRNDSGRLLFGYLQHRRGWNQQLEQSQGNFRVKIALDEKNHATHTLVT